MPVSAKRVKLLSLRYSLRMALRYFRSVLCEAWRAAVIVYFLLGERGRSFRSDYPLWPPSPCFMWACHRTKRLNFCARAASRSLEHKRKGVMLWRQRRSMSEDFMACCQREHSWGPVDAFNSLGTECASTCVVYVFTFSLLLLPLTIPPSFSSFQVWYIQEGA